MQRILMCPPTYFDVVYEINPWMHKGEKIDHALANGQWTALKKSYQEKGVHVEEITSVAGLPDMVFSANSGIVFGHKFIVSNHRYSQRKGEEKYYADWFVKHGFEVHRLHSHQSGEGDALWFKNKLYLGYGFRSDREAIDEVGKILGVAPVALHLVNPYFFDFDMAFCPIGDRVLMYYPEAFDSESQTLIDQLHPTVKLNRAEANQFECNSVLVGNTLFMSGIDNKLKEQIESYGIKVRLFDVSEFRKSGGGIKCMTLTIK